MKSTKTPAVQPATIGGTNYRLFTSVALCERSFTPPSTIIVKLPVPVPVPGPARLTEAICRPNTDGWLEAAEKWHINTSQNTHPPHQAALFPPSTASSYIGKFHDNNSLHRCREHRGIGWKGIEVKNHGEVLGRPVINTTLVAHDESNAMHAW